MVRNERMQRRRGKMTNRGESEGRLERSNRLLVGRKVKTVRRVSYEINEVCRTGRCKGGKTRWDKIRKRKEVKW